MRLHYRYLLIVAALFSATPAFAQSNVVQIDLQTFAPGVSTVTGAPLKSDTYLLGTIVCNSTAPAVPATVINPTRFFYDDLVNAGKVCIGTLVNTLLPSLPNQSGYLATVTATDNLGATSPRSAASNPFAVQAAPPARTGLKVL